MATRRLNLDIVNDPARFTNLRSALAVPLQGDANVVAVLALYRTGQDAFTQDQLRICAERGFRSWESQSKTR